MNSALPLQNSQTNGHQVQPVSVSHSGGKEKELISSQKNEKAGIVSIEAEIPKEVEHAGVQKVSETIELPPDIKKIGVSIPASSQPVQTATSNIPAVVLPITDQQVVAGLHQKKITSSLKWLALWCIRKLKKAHIALKIIHGKIKRVRI